MSTGFFNDITEIPFEGADSANPLAFRHYKPEEIVMGKRMEDHLRFAACYWHNFVWPGNDPFGGQTFERPWFPGDTMALSRLPPLILPNLSNSSISSYTVKVRAGANWAR